MSEHYDFHYQPTGSGAISGQQVLQQTEDAINELGDYVNDNVGGAMDVAQQALETAQNAEQDAQTALDTANSFSSAIQSAQQDASTALSTAQTAQTTASNANNTAIQAQQDASSAVTTANNASGQVNTLSGTVTALGQRVTTAEGNIGQNTSDITALGQRVTTAEGNITTLQNDVTIAQGNASSAMATAGQVKQQAFVFRYSSTALTPSSTNANSLLDNTDNLKVGDKVIDSSGVLFSITAIDTQNSTFTVGTALIDLANDSDVVHNTGDETIAGFKQFANIRVNNSIKGINLEGTTTDLDNCYSNFAPYGENKGGNIQYYYCNTDAGTANISNLPEAKAFFLTSITTRLISNSLYVKQILINSNSKTFTRYCANSTWSSWVNETDSEYVHKSGNEIIAGVKTFSDDIIRGYTTIASKKIIGNSNTPAVGSNGVGFLQNQATLTYADSTPTKSVTVTLEILDSNYTDGKSSAFYPNSNNITNLGKSGKIWANVYATNYYYGSSETEFSTKFVTTDTAQTISGNKTFSSINGVEPSSLSLPSDRSARIDISSYFTNTGTGDTNTYTVPANGYIYMEVNDCVSLYMYSQTTGKLSNYGNSVCRNTIGKLVGFLPVRKNDEFVSQWYTTATNVTLTSAYFIPCQGNV